ncbi:MAG: glycosyltransferase family 2 protein [Patescibacteria group bacterium]
MSKNPLVSVILLNFNGKDYTIDCIDSVLKSDYPKFEIVVVDNGSKDDSFPVLKNRYRNNKKVKIFRSDDPHQFAGGNNWGAVRAKGERLIFLSNDAVVDKNWIRELILFAKDHRKWVVQPKILNFKNRKIIDSVGSRYSFSGMALGGRYKEVDRGQYDRNYQVDFAAGACFSVDKKFYLKLGGLDPWFKFHYEDADLSLRAKKLGGKCWYCYKSIVYHIGSATLNSQEIRDEIAFHARKNRLMTVIKNFSGWERVARLLTLFPIYCFLTIQDLTSPKRERKLITLGAFFAVLTKISQNRFSSGDKNSQAESLSFTSP